MCVVHRSRVFALSHALAHFLGLELFVILSPLLDGFFSELLLGRLFFLSLFFLPAAGCRIWGMGIHVLHLLRP